VIRRETSRADRTGRQFCVVLFRVKGGGRARRPSVSTCRVARVLLRRVRQTDDVGWFDDRHLCAVLPETPAAGARVFAARACDELARRQPRPLSVVYGYPGTSAADGEADEDHAAVGAGEIAFADPTPAIAGRIFPRSSGNGGHDGDDGHHGRDGLNGKRAAALAEAVALAEAPFGNAGELGLGVRRQLNAYLLDGVASRLHRADADAAVDRAIPSSRPDGALEELFVHPMPAWKRGLDLAGASFGLLLLSPLLLVTAAAVKLTSPGPVIFAQRRAGLGGRPFTIYKFRTMCVDAERQQAALRDLSEQDGPAFKLTRDPRVTAIGQVLRKTSIDELPQLFNVLKGDMSLVGPRPLPTHEQDGCQPWQRHRLNVTPGLTCIWQVEGRSAVTFDEWVRMDVKYMRRRSLWRDLSILARTIPAVLLRRGAR
jgi:lipopolysaccharide/colanic/teichoic acid biosynthesis glycosyltransferase